MKTRIMAAIIIMAMCGAVLAGCSESSAETGAVSPAAADNDTGNTEVILRNTATADTAELTLLSVQTLNTGTDGIGRRHLDSAWDVSTSTIITLNGGAATVSGDGATAAGSTVTITEAGTYVLSGTLTSGQILVNATKDDNVRLVLNGVDITADRNAAIYAAVANSVVVILADGTVNTLTDKSTYAYATDNEEPDAALFAKCDLTINGTGTLVVNGNYKNAVRTKDDMIIVSGNYIINAVNNGIHGKDSVLVVGGEFDITAGNDGVKSSDDEKKGWVEIRGGIFNIRAEFDGIQAESDLLISGGEFNIVTGGGADNAPVRTGMFGGRDFNNFDFGDFEFPEGWEVPEGWAMRGGRGGMGGFPMPDGFEMPEGFDMRGGFGFPEGFEMPDGFGFPEGFDMSQFPGMGGRDMSGFGFPQDMDDEDTESRKGMKAGNLLYIAHGTFIIDSYDDAIHSNAYVTIDGGTFTIKTGDDGIHADVDTLINGGNIQILQSFEGIEGMTVTITGGDILVISNDDGINASNGEGKALNGGRGGFGSGASEGVYIRITGGTIEVYGQGDSIDSNGHFYMEGGLLRISGHSMGMEGAIDHDGDLIITGGEIISAGSWEKSPRESTQPVILMSYTSQLPAGTVIAIKDGSGNTILEYTGRTAFSMSGFTSPDFELGKTYTLYIDGEKRIDITLSELTTTLSDTGGAYSGGMGMGGRGGRGGMMPGRGR